MIEGLVVARRGVRKKVRVHPSSYCAQERGTGGSREVAYQTQHRALSAAYAVVP